MHHGMLAGEWPAPTIKVKEGQKLYLNLVNVGMHMRPDLFDPHSVHWHGFPQASSIFDGVPDASISINMMGNLTYYYNVVWPGTYLYHCHVEATEHMQMGMLGNLYVTPLQDNQLALYPKADGSLYKGFAYNDGDGSTGYDLDVPLQIGGFDPDVPRRPPQRAAAALRPDGRQVPDDQRPRLPRHPGIRQPAPGPDQRLRRRPGGRGAGARDGKLPRHRTGGDRRRLQRAGHHLHLRAR